MLKPFEDRDLEGCKKNLYRGSTPYGYVITANFIAANFITVDKYRKNRSNELLWPKKPH